MNTTDTGIPADLVRDPKTNTSTIAPKATVKAEPKRTGKVLPSLKQPVEPTRTTKPAVKKAAKAKSAKAVDAAHKPTQVERTEGNPQKSIVPMKFKAAYAAHDDTSGTALTLALKAYTTTKNADGRPCLDVDALKRVASANGLDISAYDALNNGQKRMNTYNRLRGMLKGGKTVVIGKTKFSDADKALAVQPIAE